MSYSVAQSVFLIKIKRCLRGRVVQVWDIFKANGYHAENKGNLLLNTPYRSSWYTRM